MSKKTTEQLFWSKVDIKSESECWEWKASKDKNGYGAFGINRKIRLAHRVVWILKYGIIPSGMCVCHKCDNPSCVNPSHLFLGTHRDNMKDRDSKNRLLHPVGVLSPLHKLTKEQIIEIRNIRNESQVSISKRFGVNHNTIWRAMCKKTYFNI